MLNRTYLSSSFLILGWMERVLFFDAVLFYSHDSWLPNQDSYFGDREISLHDKIKCQFHAMKPNN